MGDVISLAHRRAARRLAGEPQGPRPATFAFALGTPATYLAAERIDRSFPDIRWWPVLLAADLEGDPTEAALLHAERRAAVLGMPLVWPEVREDARMPSVRATRAAAYASEAGLARGFVLAAGRLAFCGGFDLDDPDVLAEAAAAAGLAPDMILAAAEDETLDASLLADGDALAAQGATRLPVLHVDGKVLVGEERLGDMVGPGGAPDRRRRRI